MDSDRTQIVTRSIATGRKSLRYSAGRRVSCDYEFVAIFTCVADERRLGMGGGGRDEQHRKDQQGARESGAGGRNAEIKSPECRRDRGCPRPAAAFAETQPEDAHCTPSLRPMAAAVGRNFLSRFLGGLSLHLRQRLPPSSATPS